MESNSTELVNGSPLLNDQSKCVNSLETKLHESEDKLHKFKALAVKLKKELNDTKDQLSHSFSEINELKSQLSKNNDKDKISASYQQIFRNFQSLQSEYDRLQDESDSLKSKNKELERDLSDSVNELTKVREQLAECKQELETLKNTIILLKEEKESLETKKREFESKVIVLQTDLESERKKIVANTGLEQSINELHYQLDLKTTDIVELTDQLERAKDSVKCFEDLLTEKERLINQVQCLEKENLNFKEDVKKYSETLETQLSEIENYKLRCADSTALIQSLESKFRVNNESQQKTNKTLETKVCELQKEVNILESDIKKKEEKFEEYKVRVCKVLKQQQNGSQSNSENSRLIENLESNIDSLNEDIKRYKEKLETTLQEKDSIESNFRQLNISHNKLKCEVSESVQLKERLNEYKSENEKLKSLARDLQSSMVNDRRGAENESKKRIEEIEANHSKTIASLQEELQITTEQLNDLKLELAKMSAGNNFVSLNKSRQSISTADDLESIETISIPNKTLSVSPHSTSGNFLEEILNSVDTQQNNNSAHDFTMHLTVAQNKVENLTQLLEDSESNNSLLTEQNRVLKEEIRRLQRSVERIEIADNLEYLKNIIVKFISLNGSDGRQQLVPVLATILKLSPEEQILFENFTADQNPNPSNKWSDILYQWSPSSK